MILKNQNTIYMNTKNEVIQRPKPHRLCLKDKVEIGNAVIEARFTPLAPETITTNVWKFVICAIAAFQKTTLCQAVMREMRNEYEKTNPNFVENLITEKFGDDDVVRQVTLRMQDIANLISVRRKVTEDKDQNQNKSYKRSDMVATCMLAHDLHLTTTKLNTFEDWARYRIDTQDESHDYLDTTLSNWNEWNAGKLTKDFTGNIFSAVRFDETKPYVTIEFSLDFLLVLLAPQKYTKLSMDHLSSFKTLGGLRLFQCCMMRKGIVPKKLSGEKIDINHGINWWRSLFGINDTLSLTLIPNGIKPEINKKAKTVLSIADIDHVMEDKDVYCDALRLAKDKHDLFVEGVAAFQQSLNTNRTNVKVSNVPQESLLIELMRGQYPEWNKLHKNVLKKAIDEVQAYASIEQKLSSLIGEPSKQHIHILKSDFKKRRGGSSVTSFCLSFKMV